MSMPRLQFRRTGWDIVLGALLVIAGFVILGNAAFATEVSVLFIGWMLVLYGIIALGGALFLIRRTGFWSAAISGALMVVLGLLFLTHNEAAAVTLTLLAGVVFLTSGIVRMLAAFHDPLFRVPLAFSGVISAVLGLIVLFDLFEVSYVLLGTLLGVYAIVDGVTMMVIGRWHIAETPGREPVTGDASQTPGTGAHDVTPSQ